MTWFDVGEEVKHAVPRTPEETVVRVYDASTAATTAAVELPHPSGAVGLVLEMVAAPDPVRLVGRLPVGAKVRVRFPSEPEVSFAGKVVDCEISSERKSDEYPNNVTWTNPLTGHALVRAIKPEWVVDYDAIAPASRAKTPVKKRRP